MIKRRRLSSISRLYASILPEGIVLEQQLYKPTVIDAEHDHQLQISDSSSSFFLQSPPSLHRLESTDTHSKSFEVERLQFKCIKCHGRLINATMNDGTAFDLCAECQSKENIDKSGFSSSELSEIESMEDNDDDFTMEPDHDQTEVPKSGRKGKKASGSKKKRRMVESTPNGRRVCVRCQNAVGSTRKDGSLVTFSLSEKGAYFKCCDICREGCRAWRRRSYSAST